MPVKAELERINSALSTENAELRAEISKLKAQLQHTCTVATVHKQISERRAQMLAAREQAMKLGKAVRV